MNKTKITISISCKHEEIQFSQDIQHKANKTNVTIYYSLEGGNVFCTDELFEYGFFFIDLFFLLRVFCFHFSFLL